MRTTLSRRQMVAGSMASALPALAACSPGSGSTTTVKIVSGSENKLLEEIIQKKADDLKASFEVTYMGSVDMARMLQAQGKDIEYDVMWPANSMWLTMGDTTGVVRDVKSVVRTPVVFSLKREMAKALGWASDDGGEWKPARDVTMDDILRAAANKDFRFAMTNATQSNSGASAYLAMCYAFSGHPAVLTMDNLNDPAMADNVEKFLNLVNRSSGSSGFLVDLVLSDYDRIDAMFNYEAMVIELNQQLVEQGKDPFFVIYPADGMMIADSPFARVDKGDEKKNEIFQGLQEYLLSDDVQNELLNRGRRNGSIGISLSWDAVDQDVFNPAWGIDVERVLTAYTVPQADVIWQSFDLYQTSLRKPSAAVFCLDFSGSMLENDHEGELAVKEAVHLLLDPESARQNLLQASARDYTGIIPFNSELIDPDESNWVVMGNDEDALRLLDMAVQDLSASGGTDIYRPIVEALSWLSTLEMDRYSAAIVLLTDGQSNNGDISEVQGARERFPSVRVPIYSIMMGSADETQLQALAELSPTGKVFDGREGDLPGILREVRGYV